MKKHVFRKLFSLAIAALPLVGTAQRVSLPYGYAARGGMSYCPNTYLPSWMAVEPEQQEQDVTFLVANPGFEENGAEHWSGDISDSDIMGEAGKKHASKSGKFNVWQELVGIPNGVYELSVQGFYEGQKSRREAYVYAGMETYALKSKSEGNGNLWSSHYSRKVRAIVVNHKLRIGVKGVYTAGGATSFDDFSLTYVGNCVVGFAAEIAENYGIDATPLWTAGDVVAVHANGAVYKYRAVSGGSQTTTLVAVENRFPELGQTYTAARPYNADDAAGTLTLPDAQAYVEDGIDTLANPMAAMAVSNGGQLGFDFKNVCGLLQLNLKGSVNVKTVQVTSNAEESLCGTGELGFDTDSNPTWSCSTGENNITLNCGESGVGLTAEAKPFHLTVPAGTLALGFTMTVTTIDNVVKTYAYGNSPILRSGITVTEAIDIDDFTAAKYGYPDGPTVSWTTNEKIALYAGETRYEYKAVNVDDGGTATFRLENGNESLSGPYTAVHPCASSSYGNGEYKLALPQTQSYVANGVASAANPAMAQSDGKSLDFKNVCGLLKLNLKGDNVSVKTITVRANNDAKLCGTGVLDFNGGNPRWTWQSGGGDNVKLSHTTAIALNNTTATPFYIALPPANYSSGLTVTVTDGTTDNTCTIELGATTITHSAVTTPATQEVVYFTLPEGALSGEFTVGMDGDTPIKVHFSKGNLWYDKSPATGSPYWGFEANQYDFRTYPGNSSMLGGAYNPESGTPANTYGLFGFGDAPANGGDIKTSTKNPDYIWPDSGDPWGSKIGEGWRTLTKDEWTYLLNVSNAESGARDKNWTRFAKAMVRSVPGLLVFPDNTTGATVGGVTINNANAEGANFTENTIDASDWSSMEAAGCVFLPCASYRRGTELLDVGTGGRYWSSTAYSSSSAYCLRFDSGNVVPAQESTGRYFGYSVRLVCPRR